MDQLSVFFPLELSAYEAGCSALQRPPFVDLFAVAVVSFVISGLLAAATDVIPWKLRELPPAMRWRARATVASLHQPLGVIFFLPARQAMEVFFTGGNPWTISAPRSLWLTLFYLLGAWFFELLILLHPSTESLKSYGKRGWSVQVAHHLEFPSFALHNIISGCAVPGTVVACYTELTIFFTSSYWIAKMAGVNDFLLLPIKVGMVTSTLVLRGAFVLLLDVRAVFNDQSELPVASWLVQCFALIGTNVLNLFILRLVQGAVMRSRKVGLDAPAFAGPIESAVKLALIYLGPGALERLQQDLDAEPRSSRPRFFRSQPVLDEPEAEAAPSPGTTASEQEISPQNEMQKEKLLALMTKIATECAGFAVEADRPLLDSGMDSKAAVQFSARLASELPGLRLPSTLVFDYPTLSAVAGYAAETTHPKLRRPAERVSAGTRSVSADEPLAVIGTACAFPGESDAPAKFGSLLAMGTDGIVEVPFTRWELDEYYDPNPDTPGKMYPRHAAFIEGAEDFAAAFFNISAPEARAMDPQQRLVLETCYDSILDSNMKQESLIGSSVAAIIGLSNNDWIQVQSGDIRKINPYTATGTSASVAAARVAYCLGLKGPAYVVDTACSSALVAVDSAAMNLRRGRCSAAVSAAANVMASPATFVSFSKPRMLSPRGRCCTFDASADGYGRGEGAGAVMLSRLLDAHGMARAALRGIAVNQDGLSSTMTAPNGPSQTQVVQTALVEAKMTHHEVLHMECHGTGTPLGDPIEVGALQAGSRHEGSRQQPMATAAVKTSVGHLEGAAASPGLLKTVTLLSRRSAFAVVHLYSLNPHLDLPEDAPQIFQSEHVPLTGRRSGALSSFGFGGTNAHAVLGESEVPVDFITLQRPPQYAKKAFPWRDFGFRLLRHQAENSFEVSMSSDVYDIVSHHVVFGSIVTPGVVYVEMAMEATRKLFGHDVALRDVTMVFPFVVPDRFSESGPPPIMRFQMKGDSRFEIQSSSNGKTTTHVEAKLEKGVKSEMQTLDLEELRSRINEPIETSVVYDAINSVGLYLGPMFQVAKGLWRKESETSSEVLGQLELNFPGVKNNGYIMHPALLDGTIHILATASIGKNVSGLKIFGGVGKVQVVKRENFSKLKRYWVHMRITESLEASQTFNIRVADDDGGVLMIMEDVVFRAVKPEQIQMAIAAQGARDDEQKLYEVQWSTRELERRDLFKSKGLIFADQEAAAGALKAIAKDQTFAKQKALETLELSSFEWILSVSTSHKRSSLTPNLLFVLKLLQSLAKSSHPKFQSLILATRHAQAIATGDMVGAFCPLHAGLWGLARAFRNEHPMGPRVLCVDLPPGGRLSDLRELPLPTSSTDEQEIAFRDQGEETQMWIPRLEEANLEPQTGLGGLSHGSFVITGGLGALGLMFASWLLEEKAEKVALISRSGKPPADSQIAFRRLASKVSVYKADIADQKALAEVMKAISKVAPIKGIIHAAGILDDHMIADLTESHVTTVLAPKADGTMNLDEAVTGQQLDFFALFSSVAALLGTPAQGNYCAANAFMDSYASYLRDQKKMPTVSIQWGPWAEVGMAARANTSESSIARISASKGLEAMKNILSSPLRSGVISVARIKWSALLGQLPFVPPFLSHFSVSKSVAPVGNYTLEDVKSLVVSALADALGSDDFDLNTPLMELGLDSLAGVEFRNRLQGAVDGINLTPTLMFDYPTVPDLVEYIWSQVGPSEDEAALQGLQGGVHIGDQLALASHSGRFPGSFGNHPGDFWRTLSSGLDTTAELPPERWDMDAFYDSDPDAPGKTYVRLGHFIPGIEQFDGEFFGLSEMEQRGMDPHQWLTLEITYDCMFASGLTKDTMNGLECGVYVGCATLGGIEPDIPAFGPFTNIGYAYSGLSGRVSHTLSLRGPCFTVDTACSATVVALDCASQAIRLGRCKSAAASGVNLQLSAAIWVGFAKMRGLAMDGNCKTFDTAADGFARGEGMGSVYVKAASTGEAGIAPAALLGGVATNHDGRAATITAPNGTAQQRVLRAALAERATAPEAVNCLECHGTGTALGDPIEVGAQKAVYGKTGGSFSLAAGKTNLGHLEGAAGVAGLSKAVLSCQRAQVPALLWLRQLNHNIDLTGFAAAIPTELFDWRKTNGRRAAVSSFGFSGTNGHALVEGLVDETTSVERAERPRASYTRRLLQPYRQWMQDVSFNEVLIPIAAAEQIDRESMLLIGEGQSFGAASTLATAELKGYPGSAEISKAIAERKPKSAVFVTGHSGDVPGDALVDLMNFLQALAQPGTVETAVVLIFKPQGPNFSSDAALWGFARSARLELRTCIKILECAEESQVVSGLNAILASQELELVATVAGNQAPRLQRCPTTSNSLQQRDVLRVPFQGSALLTGGLGGLGLVAAQELVQLGVSRLLLASRSGQPHSAQSAGRLARLEGAAEIHIKKCDTGVEADVASLTSSSMDVKLIVHAAGVLDRCMLPELTAERLQRTTKPKAHGAWYLHQAFEGLQSYVLFSSVSSILGLSGGAAYAAANGYLDGLAHWRPGTLSLRLGPVAEVGMTADSSDAKTMEAMNGMALKTLSLAQVTSALRVILAPGAMGIHELTLARADWQRYFRDAAGLVPSLQDFREDSAFSSGAAAASSGLAQLSSEERHSHVLSVIRGAASAMHLEIQDDTPLMEAGIDSLSAVEFRGKISSEFRAVRLPSTLMFDHPTLKATASYIAGQLAETSTSVESVASVMPQKNEKMSQMAKSMALKVQGAACNFPASSEFSQFSCSLWQGTDSISEMPFSRWDVDEYYDPAMPTGLEMYVRHAAFVDNVEFFDAQLFGISKAEAEAMDPQQRHLLETAYGAFMDGGWKKNHLMGKTAGVFVGQDKCDWNRMISAAHAGPFAATGGSASISSNRISYSLGLKGPSATVDTACSSSLVAADTAAMNIRRRRCDFAVICGVNMLLLPQTFIGCCQARMLSSDGRCHTFDSSASGYARGEGCGAQVLQHLDVKGLNLSQFLGSALNQDGRSANLTSPNGPSQELVLKMALQDAQLSSQQLQQVETHGTGTELGDPIETGALRAVLRGDDGDDPAPVRLGAVKGNVGHLEGGAGMAGLSKLVTQLQRKSGNVANLHLRQLNQHISEDCTDFAAIFITSATACTEAAASVSSFGFGGTNGHVVLSSPQEKVPAHPSVRFEGRQAFLWREPAHPLIRHKTRRDDGVTVLSCPIDGHVLQLLSHHIVHGEVVVPGACYLEMILAGVRAHLGPQEAWCIENLGFAKPLVLRLSSDGHLEEPVQLRLLIWPDGRLEVESEVGDDEAVTTHVEASLIQLQGGWAKNPIEKDKHNLSQLRDACPEDVDIDLMYSFGVKSGLPLQPRFRCVRQVQVQKKEPSGLARLEMERDGTQLGFFLGPSVIDSSFQALMALADADVGIGSLKIPLSIKRLQPTGRAYSIGVWSHFQLLDWTEHSTVFRSWMMNDAGESVLYFDSVHLQEVRDEHLQKVLQASGRLGAEQQALYSTMWRPMPAPEVPKSKDGWLVLGRAEDIRSSGLNADARCHCVAHGSPGSSKQSMQSVDYSDESALEAVLRKFQVVIFVGGLFQDEKTTSKAHSEDVDVLVLALHLFRAATRVARGAAVPQILLVTHRENKSKPIEPVHKGLWGFARTVRLEDSNLKITCLDADEASDVAQAVEVGLAALDTKQEEELSFQRTGEERLCCSRLTRSPLTARIPIRLNMPFRGALTGLRPVPQNMRQPVVLGSVQLRIRAVGLNFRDVLNVMGLYPGDPGPPGADCSGTVVECGERVKHLRTAEDVFGEAPGCLSTYSLAPSSLLTQKPPTWSFEEACTMPVIFVTVEEALGDLAQLKRGERVLIHAAAGGVGLVAIQYAKYVGAEIFATAGAEEKHSYLRSLGVKYITSSRSGNKFEADMKIFLEKEAAEGVDVVLNSLSHDDYISRSLACLKSGGRFIEIGKRGIWSHQQMWETRPDIMYEKIAADTMMEKEPWRYNAYLKRLLTRVDAGKLNPINMHIFEGLEEGVHALQFLQRAQNIGKVVISQPSKMCRVPGMHILSGGTGALGIVTAQFLAEEGAKAICLLSRGGQPPKEVQQRWEWLQASALEVTVKRGDVSEEAAVKAFAKDIAKGPGGAVSLLHLAGALADGMLPALDRAMFLKSYAPKVHGLRHLLRHVKFEDAAQFVLFSSTSSLFGAPGQGNYAAANANLDAFAPYWSAQAGPTVSVQWGPWAEVGMAVQKGTVQRAKASGIGSLSNSQGMAILGSVLYQAPPVQCLVGAAHVRWSKFLPTVFNAGTPSFLQDMEAEAVKSAEGKGEGGELAAALSSMGSAERLEAIQQRVKRLAVDVVGEELSGDDPLLESGMDSLSGVEFRNRLQQEFGGVRLPNSAVFDYPTANALAGFIADQFGSLEPDAGPSLPQAPAPSVATSTAMLEPLNERTSGQPIFLVPGAALQAAGFKALASLLPVPAYGVSWPSSLPRDRWPSTLSELARHILEEIRGVVPSGPLRLAGHSFGASLCLEMARQVEAAGDSVGLLILLDPRSLPPVEDAGGVFLEAGRLETLALLSETVADGAHYATLVEELSQKDAAAQAEALQNLGAAAMATLEHVHATFRWYATLLSESDTVSSIQARIHWLRAVEGWLQPDDAPNEAAKIVRRVQEQVFQRNAKVAERLGNWSSFKVLSVSGDHFSMLHEPHVASTAMRMCFSLVDAEEDIEQQSTPKEEDVVPSALAEEVDKEGKEDEEDKVDKEGKEDEEDKVDDQDKEDEEDKEDKEDKQDDTEVPPGGEPEESEGGATCGEMHQALQQEEYRWNLMAYRFGKAWDY